MRFSSSSKNNNNKKAANINTYLEIIGTSHHDIFKFYLAHKRMKINFKNDKVKHFDRTSYKKREQRGSVKKWKDNQRT